MGTYEVSQAAGLIGVADDKFHLLGNVGQHVYELDELVS